MQMPTLFLSHGAPDMALRETPTHIFLKGLAKTLPAPRALLIASAHWETDAPVLTASPNPPTIHDFQGFPDEMYAMTYDAPGDPALAERARQLLPGATLDSQRGLDHGAWSPLIIAWPEAKIPVVQLSVQPKRGAAWHYDIGRALAPLRDEGVLIIGSGNLTHNIPAAFRGGYTEVPPQVSEFSAWVSNALADKDHKKLQEWERAPHARWNHPTPEHFLPLFTALGAAGAGATATRLHDSIDMNVFAMDSYLFA